MIEGPIVTIVTMNGKRSKTATEDIVRHHCQMFNDRIRKYPMKLSDYDANKVYLHSIEKNEDGDWKVTIHQDGNKRSFSELCPIFNECFIDTYRLRENLECLN